MAKLQMTHDLHQVVAIFDGADHPWAIGGGWALDLHLGELGRRPHADVDVVSYRTAAEAMRATLDGWDLHRIIDGSFDPWVGPLEPAHQIRARPDPASDWAFEVQFEDVRDGIWRYRRNPKVILPEVDLITTIGSIPTLHLGVSLLYKAKRDEDLDLADLEACLEVLGIEDRTWLVEAVASSHGADHRWVDALGA